MTALTEYSMGYEDGKKKAEKACVESRRERIATEVLGHIVAVYVADMMPPDYGTDEHATRMRDSSVKGSVVLADALIAELDKSK